MSALICCTSDVEMVGGIAKVSHASRPDTALRVRKGNNDLRTKKERKKKRIEKLANSQTIKAKTRNQ
jgi:hypothetical protein